MGVLAPHEGILTAAAPCALHRQNTPASGYFSSHRALRAAPSALNDVESEGTLHCVPLCSPQAAHEA